MLRVVRLLTIVIAICALLGVAALGVLRSLVARARVTAAFGSCTFEQIREGQSVTGRLLQAGMIMLRQSREFFSRASF